MSTHTLPYHGKFCTKFAQVYSDLKTSMLTIFKIFRSTVAHMEKMKKKETKRKVRFKLVDLEALATVGVVTFVFLVF